MLNIIPQGPSSSHIPRDLNAKSIFISITVIIIIISIILIAVFVPTSYDKNAVIKVEDTNKVTSTNDTVYVNRI